MHHRGYSAYANLNCHFFSPLQATSCVDSDPVEPASSSEWREDSIVETAAELFSHRHFILPSLSFVVSRVSNLQEIEIPSDSNL